MQKVRNTPKKEKTTYKISNPPSHRFLEAAELYIFDSLVLV